MSVPWITVIGIGEDGLEGVSEKRRVQILSAEVLVGGERHHQKVSDFSGQRLTWGKGFHPTFDVIETYRDQRVVVLASGDPMHYGAGAALVRRFGVGDVVIHPAPGAFSLAAATMGWSLPDVVTLTVHGRPVTGAVRYFSPGAQLLVLSKDGETPTTLARLLTEHGYGQSVITVLEHLGGESENRFQGVARDWGGAATADLNTLAIECVADAGTHGLSAVPGRADDAFDHDGQITKREVRAVTLSSLAPLPGEMLWDVGAGAGSIAIEWLRSTPHARAIAIERDAARCQRIEKNAHHLGVPGLDVVEGQALDVLGQLDGSPDAVFIGGGVADDLLEAGWARLGSGGRLVANAVTTVGEAALLAFRVRHGGDLIRLSVERLEGMAGGGAESFRPLRAVLHYAGRKDGAS